MKTDDLSLGIRSNHRPECVAVTIIHQKVGEGGVTVKTFENKKRSELSFRKSQKISEQSNKPCFNGRYPNKWRSDLTSPAPLRVK